MKAHECFHCKQWIDEGQAHDCWTTTEEALIKDLADDLRDAWERIRETAVEFGDQRIYASHHSIMFARKACHFFVRPKAKYLELCVFLARSVKSPLVHSVVESSRIKRAHLIRVVHRDQVEAPLTDWMREAYELEDVVQARQVRAGNTPTRATRRSTHGATRTRRPTRSPRGASRRR
jgi:hypothetical protein